MPATPNYTSLLINNITHKFTFQKPNHTHHHFNLSTLLLPFVPTHFTQHTFKISRENKGKLKGEKLNQSQIKLSYSFSLEIQDNSNIGFLT